TAESKRYPDRHTRNYDTRDVRRGDARDRTTDFPSAARRQIRDDDSESEAERGRTHQTLSVVPVEAAGERRWRLGAGWSRFFRLLHADAWDVLSRRHASGRTSLASSLLR